MGRTSLGRSSEGRTTSSRFVFGHMRSALTTRTPRSFATYRTARSQTRTASFAPSSRTRCSRTRTVSASSAQQSGRATRRAAGRGRWRTRPASRRHCGSIWRLSGRRRKESYLSRVTKAQILQARARSQRRGIGAAHRPFSRKATAIDLIFLMANLLKIVPARRRRCADGGDAHLEPRHPHTR